MTRYEPEDDATRRDTERKYIFLTMSSECFIKISPNLPQHLRCAHVGSYNDQVCMYITFKMCLGNAVTYRSVRGLAY